MYSTAPPWWFGRAANGTAIISPQQPKVLLKHFYSRKQKYHTSVTSLEKTKQKNKPYFLVNFDKELDVNKAICGK